MARGRKRGVATPHAGRYRIDEVVKRSGKTYTEIAELIGVRKATISDVARGQSLGSLSLLERIAAVLDVPVAALFNDGGGGDTKSSNTRIAA